MAARHNRYERPVEGYVGPYKLDKLALEIRSGFEPLTNGVFEDEHRRLCVERVLWNMLRSKYGESASSILPGVRSVLLGEATNVTGDVDSWTKVFLPPVVRAYWQLQLPNLVPTQPMAGPNSRLFYQDVVYGEAGDLYDPEDFAGGLRTDLYVDPYYSLSEELPGDEVRTLLLRMSHLDFSAENRKLKAVWSDELAQDLKAMFSIDLDALMVAALGSEIAREVDQAGIDVMWASASAGDVNWSQTPSGAYADLDPKVYAATLWDAFIDADALVYEATNRHTTWIVAGTDVINRLRKLNAHKLVDGTAGSRTSSAREALTFVGILGERWEVYEAKHFPANSALLGWRGTDFTDGPAFHCPYLGLEVKDPVKSVEGDSAFATARGAMWRGKPVVVALGDGLARVNITD